MAFIELEKAFDRVPRKVIWWVLRKLVMEEWIVQIVQRMYENAWSRVSVIEGYIEEFEVKVGVHQGSVLSPLLFVIVLEVLSPESRSGVSWEDLYANDGGSFGCAYWRPGGRGFNPSRSWQHSFMKYFLRSFSPFR